ncbi:MAG: hypothetical protein R3B91_19700 [Planctomycetaceae bacterium]|nr:hypothetical protein [Planctomycetaceae bacterium]
MIAKLTEEQREAITNAAGGPIPIEDDVTSQRYVLINEDIHQRAMDALQKQEDAAAIQAGIHQFLEGNVEQFSDVDARIRSKLGLPPRT